jgi:hypothetical protein
MVEDSIWELARLNFRDIACYSTPTLAPCQIVPKATEGVLHGLLNWFPHLSHFVGPLGSDFYDIRHSPTPA